VPHSTNRILSGIRPADLRALQPHLRLVELEHGRVIAESGQRVQQVYFPHGGILSCVVELKSGFAIETGMIGDDGVFGGIQAMDGRLSLNKVIVQVPSRSSVVEAAVVKRVADSSPDFRSLIIKYEQFFLSQVQQTTACNALHSIEERTCKWLVRMYDLAGTDLPLTQEFLAQMMGVQRTSVSGVASRLQEEGLIDYHRGKVRIVNVDGLQRRACECHGAVREQYVDMLGGVAAETFPEASGLIQTV
jgi:CRP-like cAMP-binding protein